MTDVTKEKFEAVAEEARKRIEDAIAELEQDLGSPAVPAAATLWSILSGLITAAGHTVCFLEKQTPPSVRPRMVAALKDQLDDALEQARLMHSVAND